MLSAIILVICTLKPPCDGLNSVTEAHMTRMDDWLQAMM